MNYKSIFKINKNQELIYGDNSFTSMIDFWEDLIFISERLCFANPKIISLKADL